MSKSRFVNSKIKSITLLVLAIILISLIVIPSKAENEATIPDYGNLLQYEWPQIHGDPGFTRFSAGPAPESSEILWKTKVEGIQSYVTAFNGKVLVTTPTNIIALDKDSGLTVWNTTFPRTQRWPAVFKIDENHLVVTQYCLDIKTGNILWMSDEFSAKVSYWSESVYSPEEEMFYVHGNSVVEAWDFSDPTIPPTLVWETYVSGSTSSGTGIQYGDGRIFPGSFETHQMALNATTGEVLWDTETKGAMSFSGSYYDGKLLKAGEQDNIFYCFDAVSGEILWEYNPGSHLGYWISGSAAAYDMVYELNKDGNLYALDVNTGQLIWKHEGPGYMFWPGWPVVADGKVYATTGQRASYDPYTLEYSESEFVCLDAFTGELIWELDIETHCPRDSIAIAYGNLYLIPAFIEEMTMDKYETYNEIWAIGNDSWSMWRNDSSNSGTGQSGPTELNLRWKFTTMGGVVSTPIISNGKVYFGSQDKNVYCVDARDGKFLWSFTTEARIKSSMAINDGKVYVGPDDGNIYCLNAKNGDLIWETYAGGFIEASFKAVTGIRSSPIIVNNRVYVGSLDTKLYCLDSASGNIIWTYKTEGYITSSPSASNDAVYITSMESNSGTLYKIQANDGSLIWKCEIPYVIAADRGTDLHSSPTIGDGLIFVAANKQNYYAINATTGEIKWKFITTEGTEGIGGYLVASPSYNNKEVYIIDMFFITALNSSTGDVLWKSWIGTELYTTPTYADEKIYVTTDRRFVYALNATDGTRFSFFDTGSNSWSAPSLYEGRLYFGCNDGNLYCLDDNIINDGQIYCELDKNEVEINQIVTGCGQLDPGIAHTQIFLSFIKPDSSIENLQVSSQTDGTFCFNHTPDGIGEWKISIRCSGPSFIMKNEDIYFNVIETSQPNQPTENPDEPDPLPDSGIQIEIIVLVATVIILTLILIIAYFLIKKKEIN